MELNPNIRKMQCIEENLRRQFLLGLAGDDVAYHQFLYDISGYLRAFLRKHLKKLPDEVEDLVQESLLSIHNHRNTYDQKQPVTAWVYAIARYRLIDLLRSRANRDDLHIPLDDNETLLYECDETALDAHRDILVLLDELPDHFRLPLFHTKIQGMTIVEAARITGMSSSAVKVGVHRGLRLLADRMKRNSR
jgi:RNA polymerase sigma-70 factor (ECF subfamily)